MYALENVQSNHPHVALPPPVEISLNKHNISQAQTAILDAYRYDQPDSIYKVIQKSPYWSLIQNGISRFSPEYSGELKNEPVNIPYCLSKMRGVNASDTGKLFSFGSDHLICINMIAPS